MFWLRSRPHGISISDWLTAGPCATPDASTALADARESMLDALEKSGRKSDSLEAKIRKAPDLHSLWALRPELLAALSRTCGEREAFGRLAEITRFFEGLLPAAAPRGRRMPAHARP